MVRVNRASDSNAEAVFVRSLISSQYVLTKRNGVPGSLEADCRLNVRGGNSCRTFLFRAICRVLFHCNSGQPRGSHSPRTPFDTPTSVSRGRRQLVNRNCEARRSQSAALEWPGFVRLRMQHHVTFSRKNSIKMDEIIRLSGAKSSFRLRWRLAKRCALKDLRICGQETRTVSRTVGCQTECQI